MRWERTKDLEKRTPGPPLAGLVLLRGGRPTKLFKGASELRYRAPLCGNYAAGPPASGSRAAGAGGRPLNLFSSLE